MSQQLVIARYNEDVAWRLDPRLRDFSSILVYNKNPEPMPGTIPLPNVGREAHTYLTHLIRYYDTLDDFTVLAQGNPFDHCPDFLERITKPPRHEFEGFGEWLECDEKGRPHCWHGAYLPMGKVLRNLRLPPTRHFKFIGGACFRVSRARIHRRPVEFYRKVLKEGSRPHQELNAWGVPGEKHWDMAHVLERMWQLIF